MSVRLSTGAPVESLDAAPRGRTTRRQPKPQVLLFTLISATRLACSKRNSALPDIPHTLIAWRLALSSGDCLRHDPRCRLPCTTKYDCRHTREDIMSVARVTEITSSSSTSFDHAIRDGLARANKTLENVTGAWIKAQEVLSKNGKISEYRVRMKITFVLKA